MATRDLPPEVRKLMTKPLIKCSDMNQDQQTEICDLILAATDKYTNDEGTNIEAASHYLKETLDKQYGPQWQCLMGHTFAFSVSARVKSMLHCYCQSDVGVLVYKT